MAQSMSKKAFYGSGKRLRSIDVKAKIERRMKEFKQNPVPQKYKHRLASSSVWEIFYKQADAFAYMKRRRHKDLHVFSFESKVFFEHHGQRLYLVTTYEHFWHYYSQLKEAKRNYYEVIPEGAVCHLYFDLEFSKDVNPTSNGTKMVQTFVTIIQYHLRKQFNVICSRKHVIQLESSNETKFSQHLIFILPKAAFKDNINAGNFVKKICRNLSSINEYDGVADSKIEYEDSGLTKHDISDLFVFNKEKENILFCDTGVYTKNRNFRLYLSSKFKKNTPLTLAETCEYNSSSCSSIGIDEKKIFFDSLVSNVQYEPGLQILTDEESVGPSKRCHAMADVKSENKGPLVEGYRHSPYVEIDAFIESVITKIGTVGKIRRWTYFHQGELLVYDVSHNRWCHNIGREHKSNNIMLLVDIRRGVYYQKCHDPECKAIDYKSEEWKLPDNVLPAYFIQEEMSDSDGKKESCADIGRLRDVDYDKYFDSDDQELLKAMDLYELDTDIYPDWFTDIDDEEFTQITSEEISRDRSTKYPCETNKSTNNSDRLESPKENEESSAHKKVRNIDSGYYDNYLDPSWFEEDFS